MRAILLGLMLMLEGCSASQKQSSELATPATVATPQSGASEAARAAGAESRKVIIPKIRDVPASGVTTAASAGAIVTPKGASPTAVMTPQSGASEAARAAEVVSRSSIIPKIRDVPASGVTSRPSPTTVATPSRVRTSGVVGDLPRGVPYASNTDPVRIVSFAISSTIFHPGDNVTGDVVTTSNAASVTARVGSIAVTVPKVAPGKFHLQLQLPSMPLPPGDAKLIITAVRTDGKSATREIAITVAL